MRLSLRIAALIGIGVTMLVLVVSLLSMQRDLEIVEEDIARDARLVAATVAVAAEGLTAGEVQDLVRRVGAVNDNIVVEFDPRPAAGPTVVREDRGIRATIPLDTMMGSIQVMESLAPRDRWLAGSVRSLVFTTVFAMLLSLGGGLWLGRSIVGKRVTELVGKARRVAQGEFDEPVTVSGSDELTMLATELNLMAGQLNRARELSSREAEARVEAEVRLRHADRLRTVGQLAAGMAHELGTPLNVIAGHASLLMRRLDEHDVAFRSARTVHEQSERITAIVRRLLDFSRRSPSKKVLVDLSTLVEDTLAFVGPSLVGRSVELSVARGECEAAVDAEQIRQVLTNLVMNAAHAVGPSGRIRLSLVRAADRIEIRVDDDGPGVAADLRDRVLEPFYTTKEPGEGTGLGLSVVDGIIQDHNGSLKIGDSDLGGARFSVFLPLGAP